MPGARPAAHKEVDTRPDALHRFLLLRRELHHGTLVVHAGAGVQGEATHAIHVQVEVTVGLELRRNLARLRRRRGPSPAAARRASRSRHRPALSPDPARRQGASLHPPAPPADACPGPRLGLDEKRGVVLLPAGKLVLDLPQHGIPGGTGAIPGQEAPAQIVQGGGIDAGKRAEAEEIVGGGARFLSAQPGTAVPARRATAACSAMMRETTVRASPARPAALTTGPVRLQAGREPFERAGAAGPFEDELFDEGVQGAHERSRVGLGRGRRPLIRSSSVCVSPRSPFMRSGVPPGRLLHGRRRCQFGRGADLPSVFSTMTPAIVTRPPASAATVGTSPSHRNAITSDRMGKG